MKAPAFLAFGSCGRATLVGAAAIAIASVGTSEAHASSLDSIQAAQMAGVSCFNPASNAPYRGFANRDLTREILGGAPSALERIRLSQSGGAEPAAVEPAKAVLPSMEILKGSLYPAARQLTAIPTPVLSTPQAECPPATDAESTSRFALPRGLRALGDAPVAFDNGLEIGTRAVAIKRTRFDARWAKVSKDAPARLMYAELRKADVAPGLDEAEVLSRVNRWVNRQIAYRSDQQNYRQRDFWATAQQTLSRGAGDCEDFAILKMHMLRAAGIDSTRMKLMLLRDLAANGDHAFLVVETDRGSVVLDNTIDRVYRVNEAVAVRPILSFGPTGSWVHAYSERSPVAAVSAPATGSQKVQLSFNQPAVSALPTTVISFSK